MQVQGNLKESDFVASTFVHLRPRPFFAVIGILLLCLAGLTVFLGHSFLLLFILIYIGGIFFLYMPFKAKQNFRQNKALNESITMEVGDKGLFFKRVNAEGLVPWSHIMKWKSNKKLCLLYITKNMFHVVPSHLFASQDEFQMFLKMLESHLGKSS